MGTRAKKPTAPGDAGPGVTPPVVLVRQGPKRRNPKAKKKASPPAPGEFSRRFPSVPAPFRGKTADDVERRKRGLAARPPIRPLPSHAGLAYAAHLVGGKERLIELASISDDPKVKLTVHRWNQLTMSERNGIRLETICEGAEISPSEWYGKVVQAAFQRNIDHANLLAAIAMTQVVTSTLDSAMMPGREGMGDRKMMLQHANFLPMPKGATINVQNNAVANAQADAGNEMMDFENDMLALPAAFDQPEEPQVIESSFSGEEEEQEDV